VVDKRDRPDNQAIRRRRECLSCGKRFTTDERVAHVHVAVIKKDGSHQQFDREKIRKGLFRAAEKRPITEENIDRMVDVIERRIRRLKGNGIPSEKIGQYVMSMLKKKDEVAYMRFASVYRDFENLGSFEEELEQLKKI